jgi:hypothetical protein
MHNPNKKTRTGVYWASGRLTGLILATDSEHVLAAAFSEYDPGASAAERLAVRQRIAVTVAETVTELEIRAAEAGIGVEPGWNFEEQSAYVQQVLNASRARPLLVKVEEWPATQPLLVVCRHLLHGGREPRGHVQIVDGVSTAGLLRSLRILGLLTCGEL